MLVEGKRLIDWTVRPRGKLSSGNCGQHCLSRWPHSEKRNVSVWRPSVRLSQLSRLRNYERMVEIVVFEKGVDHFQRKFYRKWGVAHKRLLAFKKTRVPELSRGV